MIKFPKIQTFDGFRKTVQKYPHILDTANFVQSVKLHGTNCSVVRKDGKIQFQSRNRILTPEDDNYEFASTLSNIDLNHVLDKFGILNVAVYGEWIGKGIQNSVAVSKMDRKFVVFAIRDLTTDTWVPVWKLNHSFIGLDDCGIHSIYEGVDEPPVISFNALDDSDVGRVKEYFNEIVEEVEKQCPFAALFDVEGPGEGYVFVALGENGNPHPNTNLWFKVKGSKHKNSRIREPKVQLDPSIQNEISEFVQRTVTTERIDQGFQYLDEMNLDRTMENLGKFIQWVVNDILTEEKNDIDSNPVLSENLKAVRKQLTNVVKQYFMENV